MRAVSKKLVCLSLYCSLIIYLLDAKEAGAVDNVVSVPNQFGNLSDYLCGTLASTILNGTTMQLDPNVKHIMSGTFCTWQGRGFVTIQGSETRQAVIQCDSDNYTQIGFSFVEMRNFTLRNIRFENCGGVTQNPSSIAPISTSPRRAIDSNQHAVLFLARCIHVNIENVTFSKYRGYAVYGINLLGANRVQQVTVTDSFAYVNGMRSSIGRDLTYSGSGLFFHFSDRMSLPVSDDSTVMVTNSTLSDNFNIYPDFYIRSLQETRLQNQQDDFPLHGCGGLTVHFEQRDRKAIVYVENTYFLNNGGSAGGGSQIVWRNTMDNSDLLLSGCTFVNNSVANKYGNFFVGGGLQLLFIFAYSQLLEVSETAGSTKAIIRIENSIFQDHSGVLGAALAIFTEAQNVTTINIDIASVQFENNEATIDGDCIYVESENSAIYSEIRPHLVLENILVYHHSNENNDLGSVAALSFNNIYVTIIGSAQSPTIISNGRNGGLKLFNTYGFLTGEVHFRNNSAMKGGAITMEANSYLFFKEPANIHFLNNKAIYGGAIYSDIVRGSQCVVQFISRNNDNPILNSTQLDELNVTLTFVDNEADRDGNAIYAQPIIKCNWFSESIVQIPIDNLPDLYNSLYHFQTNGTLETYKDQVRSHPYQPCACQQNGMEPVCVPILNNNITISVPPGRSFLFPIVPVDKLWSPLQSVVSAEIRGEQGNTEVRFQNNQSRYVIDLNGTACYPLNFVLRNAENTIVYITTSIPNVVGQFINSTVILEQCPFGFELNTASGICDCVQIFAQYRIKCDIEKVQFIKTVTSYWIGRTKFEDDVPACVLRCPSGYCQPQSNISLTFDNQCNGNRYGEICGKCKPGFSMQFGTTDCKKCSSYWLFTIILYILAGIVLVVCLFLFKLTITEGLLGSILFYAQLFSINIGLLVYSNETRFTTVFVSLLNLELGFPLCFYNGMTQIAKHGLQFIFPVYLWLIVAVITLLSRYSSKMANLVGSECAKVFVSLIYFSYTKLQRTAINVLIFTNIRTNTNSTYTVWFYDGRERYFHGKHLILALVSISFLLFILTPYMFGAFLSQWCLHSSWVSRHFKPLIDATLAPFKDRWRFWFGLRLLVINILILTIVFVSPLSSDAGIYAHLVIILVLLVCQANIKPYKSKLIHYLDLFFLINYIFYLIGCLFIFGVLKPTREEAEHLIIVVEVVIIGSAFAVFVFTIACHVLLRVKKVYEQKKKGGMTPNKMGDEFDTKMEHTTSFNSNNNNEDEMRLQNVTLTVVDIRNDEDNDDGARLRESLLADYN